MSITANTKTQLWKACMDHVEERVARLQQALDDIQQAKSGETKSSAGDKHETGRAMLQLEEQQIARQLQLALQDQTTLESTLPDQSNKAVSPGALVTTPKFSYYVAIGVGQIQLEDQLYFVISTNSPIYKALEGKKVGDQIVFNGNTIIVDAIE